MLNTHQAKWLDTHSFGILI